MDSVAEQLEAIVATGFPGAVAVALGPHGRVEAAAGFADLRTGEALTVDHRFRIGSVTKIFVAALVLDLVAEGLLDLDGDAAPFAEGITIRQLLNHTSGLPDFVDDPVSFFEPWRRDPAHRWELGPSDELRLVMEKPRLFAPGEGWAYHGSNYIVLRLVVEEATDVTLREPLRQRIFGPLGLNRTDLVEGPLRGDCARGYLPPDNPILPGGPGPVMSRTSTSPSTEPGAASSRPPARSQGCFEPSLEASCFPAAFAKRCSAPSSRIGRRPTDTGSGSARSAL